MDSGRCHNIAAVVDDNDYHVVSKLKWALDKRKHTSYAIAYLPGNKKIRLHRYILSAPKGMVIDHINRNGLDNRRENLRVVTYRENSNYGIGAAKARKYSKYKGVEHIVNSDRWRSRLWLKGYIVNVGIFASEIEAAKAYDQAIDVLLEGQGFKNFPN